MKKHCLVICLSILSSTAAALVPAELIEEKDSIREEMASMSCSEFKAGLSELADNVDVLRHLEKGSLEFEIALYGIRSAFVKAKSCIE
ncbi:hypothetical protein NA643_15445 [Pseudomonas stutzeri]|uniref:hypothetical protein n=1 Tax=Stutzerimonas stutzeri TaxID=316 RepID=UPI000C9C32DC|nr:hypothetical protein [Stutzerimonas stutzeri]MCQ4280488.1 hypothetical protein [Stutzerimonas stutzeri]PNF71528.1 hypothetical protein CXK96_16965 [Stutzerimonas stutzeri]